MGEEQKYKGEFIDKYLNSLKKDIHEGMFFEIVNGKARSTIYEYRRIKKACGHYVYKC
jgi:hypothetical protein